MNTQGKINTLEKLNKKIENYSIIYIQYKETNDYIRINKDSLLNIGICRIKEKDFKKYILSEDNKNPFLDKNPNTNNKVNKIFLYKNSHTLNKIKIDSFITSLQLSNNLKIHDFNNIPKPPTPPKPRLVTEGKMITEYHIKKNKEVDNSKKIKIGFFLILIIILILFYI
jgi:hypothetical protein